MPSHPSSPLRCLTTGVLVAVACLAPAGCRQRTLADGVTDSTFVATMAELEKIERTPGMDSSARVAARAATLQRRGLARRQLERAAASLADDPKRAIRLYRAIEAKASGQPLVTEEEGSGSTVLRRPPARKTVP